jgi:neutral amino acid transport system permease protein
MPLMRVTQLIVFGIGTGAFLLISTLGFALVRRVEGFLNIAHAELMSVAAFTTWYLNVSLGWHFLLAAALAVLLTVGITLVIARLVYDPIKHLCRSGLRAPRDRRGIHWRRHSVLRDSTL